MQVLLKAKETLNLEHLPLLVDKKMSHNSMFIVMTLLGESLNDVKRRQHGKVFR